MWDRGEGGRVSQSLVHGLLLLEDVHAFKDGIDESMGRRLQWHTIAVISCSFSLSPNQLLCTFLLFLYLSSLPRQAAQLAHILDERLKELADDADREKPLKDMAEVTAKEKTKTTATMEKKATASEKARVAAEKRFSKLEVKLGEIELKLAEATSMNTARVEELADLKAALEACENE